MGPTGSGFPFDGAFDLVRPHHFDDRGSTDFAHADVLPRPFFSTLVTVNEC